MTPPEALAISEIPALLTRWLGQAGGPVAVSAHPGIDLLVDIPAHRLAFEVKSRDDVPTLERAVAALERAPLPPGTLRVVVVPFAGSGAREWLRARGQSWLDLSGNADLAAPGLRILVEGRPNRFATAGRPASVFSPRAARITRWMLLDSARRWTQAELVAATRLSHGFVSKVVRRMAEDGLLAREGSRFRVGDPGLLLDAWAQHPSFSDHHITRCQFAARTGPSTLRGLGERLDEAGLVWAATGLAAAWSITRFADFRLTSLYLRRPLFDPGAFGLHPVGRGENVWVIVPRDEGVFDGVQRIDEIPCVSPAQVYLDLAAHPERAKEAADELRTRMLSGGAR